MGLVLIIFLFWLFLIPLIYLHSGKIYVVGGNDGQSALNSIEVYDPETHTWSVGPTLSCHRANCGVAILDDRMFAVGGFNGKKFLNSVEYLDMKDLDFWNAFMPNTETLEVSLDGNLLNTGGADSQAGTSTTCTKSDDVIVKNKLDSLISENKGAKTDIVNNGTCNGDIKTNGERHS